MYEILTFSIFISVMISICYVYLDYYYRKSIGIDRETYSSTFYMYAIRRTIYVLGFIFNWFFLTKLIMGPTTINTCSFILISILILPGLLCLLAYKHKKIIKN